MDFATAFATFLAGCTKISDDYFAAHFKNLPKPTFTTEPGRRYVRIIRADSGGSNRSVHAFVDKTNGDVLKPASWRAPAKHARGNIYDAKNGLGSMGEYGPAYLR